MEYKDCNHLILHFPMLTGPIIFTNPNQEIFDFAKDERGNVYQIYDADKAGTTWWGLDIYNQANQLVPSECTEATEEEYVTAKAEFEKTEQNDAVRAALVASAKEYEQEREGDMGDSEQAIAAALDNYLMNENASTIVSNLVEKLKEQGFKLERI